MNHQNYILLYIGLKEQDVHRASMAMGCSTIYKISNTTLNLQYFVIMQRTGVVPTDCKVIIEESTPFGIQCHDERYDFDLIVQEILSKSSVREYNFSITAEDQTSMVTVRIRPPSISLAITSEINVNLIEVGQVLPTNPICMDGNDDVTTLPNGRNNGKFAFYLYDFDISTKSTQIYSYFSIRNDSLIEIVRHPLELYTNNITNFVLNIVCTDFGSPQSLRTLARINISLFGKAMPFSSYFYTCRYLRLEIIAGIHL